MSYLKVLKQLYGKIPCDEYNKYLYLNELIEFEYLKYLEPLDSVYDVLHFKQCNENSQPILSNNSCEKNNIELSTDNNLNLNGIVQNDAKTQKLLKNSYLLNCCKTKWLCIKIC